MFYKGTRRREESVGIGQHKNSSNNKEKVKNKATDNDLVSHSSKLSRVRKTERNS